MQQSISYILTSEIYPNIYQPRKTFNEESIEELAQSISAYGIIQPISVRRMGEGRFELVAGERRLRAAKKLCLEKVPVILVDINDKESAAIALLENIQREDLNFIEEAVAYYNLIKEHSYTQEQLAFTIGKKQSTIANKLRILKLSNDIRAELIKNKLTERHARALLKIQEESMQIKILTIVIEKKLNVKATEELIEKEILKGMHSEAKKEKKKKIIGSFNTKIYINTIKQLFDKFGVNAIYKSNEVDEYLEVIVRIPKLNK